MSIAIYQQCTALAILAVLLIATFYDCKSSIIPLYLFPTLVAAIVPLAVISGQPQITDSLIGMLIGTGTFLTLAIFFKGGGADILMMGTLGWCLGVRGVIILTLASSVVYSVFASIVVLYCLFKKRPREFLHKQYPFAPFILTGYIVCLLFGWLF